MNVDSADIKLLSDVRDRMDRLDASQASVAEACGLSQPHLSKVLNNKINLARKTRARLSSWLEQEASSQENVSMADIIGRLGGRPPHQVAQIMQFLHSLDRMLP